MHYIYLSPHLDDVAYSCGGLVWQQTQAGHTVEIWTICAGDPPDAPLPPLAEEHHQRWGVGREAVTVRRGEDIDASRKLGAIGRHFGVPDAIYRRHPETGAVLYPTAESIFGVLHPGDENLIETLASQLSAMLPPDTELLAPLTVGDHVDHQFVYRLAQRMKRPLCYYADFPYVNKYPQQVAEKLPPDAKVQLHTLTDEAMQTWGDAIAAHASQLNTFWPNEEAMRAALESYIRSYGGLLLWQMR